MHTTLRSERSRIHPLPSPFPYFCSTPAFCVRTTTGEPQTDPAGDVKPPICTPFPVQRKGALNLVRLWAPFYPLTYSVNVRARDLRSRRAGHADGRCTTLAGVCTKDSVSSVSSITSRFLPPSPKRNVRTVYLSKTLHLVAILTKVMVATEICKALPSKFRISTPMSSGSSTAFRLPKAFLNTLLATNRLNTYAIDVVNHGKGILVC